MSYWRAAVWFLYPLGFVFTLYWSARTAREETLSRRLGCLSWSILIVCSLLWPIIAPLSVLMYFGKRRP